MDPLSNRLAILALAVISCFAIGGIVAVDLAGGTPPTALATVAGVTSGALAALLQPRDRS